MVITPVAGLLLGFLDFVWIKYVPFPFGGLGNSPAVWAVAAFLLTWRARWRVWPSAAAGAAMLVIAVPAYYVAAYLIQHDELGNAYNATALVWMALGVAVGAVFGAGGYFARTPGRSRIVAIFLPGGVLLAEAAVVATRAGQRSYAVLLVVLALVVTVLVRRRAVRE
ncbi:DUF6518 family protein [Actinoplanes subtropicus]|uniref:DUF6518 family protein n=1 Tax=Actinoplanes subtropicus TaxID=543632 RepID=UPI0006900977|nr:DUF6518 family protein [Actinoplanes subtropicus]